MLLLSLLLRAHPRRLVKIVLGGSTARHRAASSTIGGDLGLPLPWYNLFLLIIAVHRVLLWLISQDEPREIARAAAAAARWGRSRDQRGMDFAFTFVLGPSRRVGGA